MNEEKRMNGGYEIIESCQIGRTELVIGHNSKAPNPYVCWYCKDGSDYFWGYYCNQLSEARDKLNERYQNECRMPYNQPEKKQRRITMTENAKKKYDCATCPYPRYKEGTVIFCDVCMQKILDRKKEKQRQEDGNE